jgi:hypothetical protein
MKPLLEEPCQPAGRIISRLGGVAAVARICGCSDSSVYRWQMSVARHGTGGIIPTRRMILILRYAQASNLPITARDFVPDAQSGPGDIDEPTAPAIPSG